MKTTDHGTRAAILSAAVGSIRRASSVREITVRAIIEEAGVNLNAVNYHFGSKENLVREAVRAVIGEYFRSRGLEPGTGGKDPRARLSRICDFLFDEPVAARLALESEIAALGGGSSLSSETMAALEELWPRGAPGIDTADIRFRVWTVVAVVHQFLLRPEGCKDWLGADPGMKAEREALLDRLAALAGA